MIPELTECKTWECINSFSSWLSAIGTILISGLALWLAWKDRLIRVRAYFNFGLTVGENPNLLNKEVYILEITNIGHRTATITNYEWRIRKWPSFWRWNRFITFPQMDREVQHLCSTFPLELTDGKKGMVFHKGKFFEDLDDHEQHLFPSSYMKAFVRIFDFRMYIQTTTGKAIKAHIPFRVRKYIWKSYLKFRT